MSTFNRMLVFPEGRTAETVLAVDLDDETTEYLGTYPGTAEWLSPYAAEKLRHDLSKTGTLETEIPGLSAALSHDPESFKELLLAYSRLWALGAGITTFMLMLIFGERGWFWIDLGAGLAVTLLVATFTNENKRRRRTHDQEQKRVYDDLLLNSSDHLIYIEDLDADVREAYSLGDTINDNLAQVKSYGLSTVDESAALDEHLASLLKAHIAERSAQSRLEHFEEVLRGIDTETIAADEDLQNMQHLREELARTVEAARQRASVAKNELHQLETTTATTARQSKAKLLAAELRGQEATPVYDDDRTSIDVDGRREGTED